MSFDPPDVRMVVGTRLHPIESYQERDCIYVPNFYGDTLDLTMYNQLAREIREAEAHLRKNNRNKSIMHVL